MASLKSNSPARLKGVPLVQLPEFTGQVFYVDSNNGVDSAGTYGKSPDKPFASWDYAHNQCTANHGDKILLAENHAETITAAAGVVLDLAGVETIGLGSGSQRPTITFTTAAGADIDASAADVKISNVVFVCNIASQTAMLDVAAAGDGLVIDNCEFREGSATGLNFITLADADDVVIKNSRFFAPTAGNYNDAISIDAALDRLTIENCYIRGDFDDAGIHNPTGNVATNLLIKGCTVENLQSGQHAIELVSACTGWIVDCHLGGDTLGTILDPGSCRLSNVKESAAIDTPAVESPVAVTDSAANILGADNSNNAFASTNVAANKDGSIIERLEQIMEAVNPDSGTSLAATESLADILYAGNGIATFPAAAAPANGVSIAEVLRDTWDAVRNGTGGSEPATNKSIIDALGFDGSAFVAGGLAKYLPQCVAKTDGAVLSGNDDLFTVVGTVKATIFGLVTTVLGGAANGKLQFTSTVPAATVDLNAAAVAVDTDAAGTIYRNVGATSVFTPSTSLGYVLVDPVTVEETYFILSDGTVHFNSSAAQSGVIAWYCTFTPLTPGASVTAAA